MFNVIRHYLPLRKALLVLSETFLLTLIVFAAMSAHLWQPPKALRDELAYHSLGVSGALAHCLLASLLVALLSQIALSFNELYDFRISGSSYDRATRFLGSAGSAVLLAVLAVGASALVQPRVGLDFPGLPFSQTTVILATTLGVAFLVLYQWRRLFHSVLWRTRMHGRVLVLGAGKLAERLVTEIAGRPELGFELVGIVSPAHMPRERRQTDLGGPIRASSTGNPWFEAGGPARAGFFTDPRPDPETELVLRDPADASLATQGEPVTEPLCDLASRLAVDDIIVAFEERRRGLPTNELLRCRLEGIVVHEAEAFFEGMTGKIPAEAMRPSYLIFNPGFRQRPLGRIIKRSFDIVGALIGLVLAAPVMLVAALVIRLQSAGPIFFRQERVGHKGDVFTLIKFRSMRADAEQATGPVWAQQNDPRVTPVGRYLRRTRIDELPQLLNVLAGSMSLVGPRPERPPFVEQLSERVPYFQQRHLVKPGITGWAQINYPYANSVEDALQKLQYDLFYIKHRSLAFDLSILLSTVKIVVLRKGT
jgi:lipopolysaccharide/colanic/teichoic acid biosynthesis glycosyltransferase